MRQIMIGKARPEYRRYVVDVPPEQREPAQPSTPDPRARVSKRQFDRALSEWRRRLHEFDSTPGPLSLSWADASSSVRVEGGQPGIAGETVTQKSLSKKQRARKSQENQDANIMNGSGQNGVTQDGAGVVLLRLADQILGDAASPGPSAQQWAMSPTDPTTPSANRIRNVLSARSDMGSEEKTVAPFNSRLQHHAPDPSSMMMNCFMMNPNAPEWGAHQQYGMLDASCGAVTAPAQPDVDLSMGRDTVPRWPTPPKKDFGAWDRPASPRTPPRPRRIFGGPSPPSSAIRTPNRGAWMTETPSPDRMYHSALRTQVQPPVLHSQLPTPQEMSAMNMGPPMDMQTFCGHWGMGGWQGPTA